MTWSKTRPGTQRLRGTEPGNVTDFGDEDRGDRRSHSSQALDGLVAAVVTELLVDLAFQHDDLMVVHGDEIA